MLPDEYRAVDALDFAAGESRRYDLEGTAVGIGLPVGGDEYQPGQREEVGVCGGEERAVVGVDDRRRQGEGHGFEAVPVGEAAYLLAHCGFLGIVGVRGIEAHVVKYRAVGSEAGEGIDVRVGVVALDRTSIV